MGMVAQGCLIRTATTGVVQTTSTGTPYDIGTDNIACTAATDASGVNFTENFTTNMVLSISGTDNTAYYPIKSVAATVITVWGVLNNTGSTSGLILTGTSMVEISEITDFSGPGGQAAVIDMTHLQSTAKEKKIGLRDEGQLSLSVNFNATDAGQKQCLADRAGRLQRLYDIAYTDTSIGSSHYPSRDWFMGYCLGFTKSGAVDDKVPAQIVIEIDGPVIETTKISS